MPVLVIIIIELMTLFTASLRIFLPVIVWKGARENNAETWSRNVLPQDYTKFTQILLCDATVK